MGCGLMSWSGAVQEIIFVLHSGLEMSLLSLAYLVVSRSCRTVSCWTCAIGQDYAIMPLLFRGTRLVMVPICCELISKSESGRIEFGSGTNLLQSPCHC